MVELRDQDLSGSVFVDVDLSRATFREAHLDGARFIGVWGGRLDVDGDFDELLYNGIDLIPLWRAEMVRRHPEFALLPPEDADGYRAVWPLLEGIWATTVTRARALPEELLHERVDGEWSFIETLRHMMFVHDGWLRHAVLGEPWPYDELDLRHDDMPPVEGLPHQPDARPSLDQALELLEVRRAIARGCLADLTDEALAADTAVVGPGYPEAGSYAVQRCLRAVVNEEWWHHRFAERDLSALESR
jgi:hypothetical protein